MQGALPRRKTAASSRFPCKSWREEFARAREAGLDYIEWIHDEYGRTANPIFSQAGLAEFDALKHRYGIATPALCGDWFMDFPLNPLHHGGASPARAASARTYSHRRPHWKPKRIVLPFVDQSKITTEDEKAGSNLRAASARSPSHSRTNVELHLEADFNPTDCRLLPCPHRASRPQGQLGLPATVGLASHRLEEFAAYGHRIGSVHDQGPL